MAGFGSPFAFRNLGLGETFGSLPPSNTTDVLRLSYQTADSQRPLPFWLRAAALFCALLFGGISTAQAAHIHSRWLPQSAPHATEHTAATAVPEDTCPLCVAMHSAMPARLVEVAPISPVTRVQAPAPVARDVAAVWRFELFSRPPPVLL